jgi:hypothetical protein
MKIIDKTPYQNQKGEFGLVQRIQSAMEYGGAWHAELEAQKSIIAQLDRVLEKGFTLIRNLKLEKSQIIEPLILIGPPGVFVMYVTPVSGFFEAKGDQWNIVNNDRRQPAPVNLMARVARLARALQVYLNRQEMFLPGMFEPVLVASNPAVHIEQLRPMVRVVMSDAVKQFAVSLMQSRPVLKAPEINDLVDHIIHPHRKSGPVEAEPGAVQTPAAAATADSPTTPQEETSPTPAPEPPIADQAPARARAIFQAAEELKPFDPADLSFAFDEKAAIEAGADSSEPKPRKAGRRLAGMTVGQWVVLVVMLLVTFLTLGSLGYMLYANGL